MRIRLLLSLSGMFWFATPASYAGWSFIFADKEYATNLVVQTAIATKDQLQYLILDTNDTLKAFAQKSNEEIGTNDAYVFIRVKNMGERAAWGTLSIIVENHGAFEMDVPFVQRDKTWCQYIIHDAGIYFKSNKKPDISIHWEHLYSK